MSLCIGRKVSDGLDSARVIERVGYGLVSDASSEAELKEARDVLRLAVGLRRMLERMNNHRVDGKPGIGPGARDAQER